MTRRLALILALLSPAAALSQGTPAAGTVTIVPASFGKDDCTSTSSVGLTWTSSSSVSPVAGNNEIYRVRVSLNSTCVTTSTPTGTQLGEDIAAATLTQSYQATLTRQAFLSTAGVTDCTVDQTIYVCVQHLDSADAVKGVAKGSARLQVQPPPVPINVGVAPGDSALFVSWAAGTNSTSGTNIVAAASYNVTAVAQTNTLDTHTRNSVGKSYRIGGLINDRTYDVTVTALSAGGIESAPSVAVSGTPQLVNDFWDDYSEAEGPEQGGCGGGPAGLISLVGVALVLRGLRRRS